MVVQKAIDRTADVELGNFASRLASRMAVEVCRLLLLIGDVEEHGACTLVFV